MRVLGVSQLISIFLMASTIACAEYTKLQYMVIWYIRISSWENPFWWMIFICLTIIDFPDSSKPVKQGVIACVDVKGRDGRLMPPITLQADESEVVP